MKRNTKDVKIQCPRDTLMELLRAKCIFVEFVISARAAICLLYAIVLIVFRSVGEDLKGFQNNADTLSNMILLLRTMLNKQEMHYLSRLNFNYRLRWLFSGTLYLPMWTIFNRYVNLGYYV